MSLERIPLTVLLKRRGNTTLWEGLEWIFNCRPGEGRIFFTGTALTKCNDFVKPTIHSRMITWFLSARSSMQYTIIIFCLYLLKYWTQMSSLN